MSTDEGQELWQARLGEALANLNLTCEERFGRIETGLAVLIAQREAGEKETARAHKRIDGWEARIRSNFILALTSLAFPLIVGGVFFLLNRAVSR